MHNVAKPFLPFADWLAAMLGKRGLQQPDGRPLYRYRLCDAEFESLDQLLRTKAGTEISRMDKQRGFCACWFLYAAEWWKRRYAGGAWAWAPICRDAGITAEVSQVQRSEWVNAAVHYWRLEDQIERGKRYIGRVVSNGGLPLQLIADAAGGVAKLLNIVQQEVACSRVPMTDVQIMAALAERARLLPECYRQQHVLELLAEVLLTVRRLNSELVAAEGEDPVACLDRLHPGWKDEFPLQLEPAHARTLLGGLVRRAHAGREQRQFQIVRQLRFDSQGRPARLETVLEAAGRIDEERLLDLLGVGVDSSISLPAAMDLVLIANGTSRHAGKLTRREGMFQIHTDGACLPESWLGLDIELELSRYGQPLGRIELPGGDAPDEQQPWIFEDAAPMSRLLGCGNLRLRDQSCIVLHKPRALVLAMQEDPKTLGTLQDWQVVRVFSGELNVSIGGELYRIFCADPSAREVGTLVWYGQQIGNCRSQPARVFSGNETAYEVLPTGERRQIPRGELFWQFERGELLPLTSTRKAGMGWLVWKRDGHIRSRARAVSLPAGAAVRIEPDADGLADGSVILSGWPAQSVDVVTNEARVTVKRAGHDWVLHCQKTGSTPPVNLMLEVRWPGGGVQHVTVPYPAEGAFIYSENGAVLDVARCISVSDLLGLNLRIQSTRARRWRIELALQNCLNTQLASRCLPVRFAGSDAVTDLRLFELQDDVRQLLATVDELDAQVRISVRRDGQECRSLVVGRYRDRLVREDGHVALMLDEALPADEVLKATRLLALPMLEPDSYPVELEARHSEFACTGRWAFDPDRFKPGVWLIYPAAGSALDCRPIAWYVAERFAGPPRTYGGLRGAMVLAERTERLDALQTQLELMACDPNHADWRLVAHYVRQLGHLPLAGLDLWVALMRCPRAVIMALLQVDGFAECIAHRLSTELPFEWLLTSPQDWLVVVSALVSELDGRDERELRLMRREIEAKLEWLRRMYPSLELSISLALSRGLSRKQTVDVELLLAEPAMLRDCWLQKLFNGETSDVQGLLQRASHAERGPGELNSYASDFAASSFGGQLLHGFRLPRGDWKYSLAVVPLAVAYDIAAGRARYWLHNRSRLVSLRTYRTFDAHWFDEAYKVAMVCAFDDGLIEV